MKVWPMAVMILYQCLMTINESSNENKYKLNEKRNLVVILI